MPYIVIVIVHDIVACQQVLWVRSLRYDWQRIYEELEHQLDPWGMTVAYGPDMQSDVKKHCGTYVRVQDIDMTMAMTYCHCNINARLAKHQFRAIRQKYKYR